MSSARLRVVRTPRFRRDFELLTTGDARAGDALAGLEEVIARRPDLGMAVAGQRDCFGRPIHTEHGSYLVVYMLAGDVVYLVGIRRIPQTAF